MIWNVEYVLCSGSWNLGMWNTTEHIFLCSEHACVKTYQPCVKYMHVYSWNFEGENTKNKLLIKYYESLILMFSFLGIVYFLTSFNKSKLKINPCDRKKNFRLRSSVCDVYFTNCYLLIIFFKLIFECIIILFTLFR